MVKYIKVKQNQGASYAKKELTGISIKTHERGVGYD